jgi:hypothetical protein
MQNDRPALPTGPGQKDEGVEAGAVAHRYHGLESTCSDRIINNSHRPHLAVAFRRVNMTATLVIPPCDSNTDVPRSRVSAPSIPANLSNTLRCMGACRNVLAQSQERRE